VPEAALSRGLRSLHHCFPGDYADARQRFLSAARGAGAEIASSVCPETGLQGEALDPVIAQVLDSYGDGRIQHPLEKSMAQTGTQKPQT
jgi:hypothetical protein